MQWEEWKKIERGTSYASLNLRQWGHFHVEEFINGAWQSIRIYPKGVPPY